MSSINFKFLLISLLILVLAIPSLNQHEISRHPDLLEVVFGTSLMFGAFSLIQNARERSYSIGIFVAVFAILCGVISIFTELEVFSHLMLASAVIFFVFGIVFSVYQVFVIQKGVDFNKIIGAICIYIFLTLLWTVFYQFLEIFVPGSFNGIAPGLKHDHFNDLLYFSIVTITTLGYGDISPVTPFAKALVVIEAVAGVFYIAILVAALVGDFMATRLQKNN